MLYKLEQNVFRYFWLRNFGDSCFHKHAETCVENSEKA